VQDEPLTLYMVKRLELVIRARMDVALRPFGLSTVQFTALTALRARDGLSSAQLARRSFVTPQTMNEMVHSLERRGLIARRQAPDNRRVLLLTLTDSGQGLLAQCDPLVEAIEGEMLAAIPAGQHGLLRQSLDLGYAALAEGALPT
jgi:DNA-binding MarR family transcriptional regulator